MRRTVEGEGVGNRPGRDHHLDTATGPPHPRRSAAKVFALGGLFVLASPSFAFAAGDLHVPPAAAGPFVLLLVAIAALPLVAAGWWHHNRHKALVAAALALPVAGYLLAEGEA